MSKTPLPLTHNGKYTFLPVFDTCRSSKSSSLLYLLLCKVVHGQSWVLIWWTLFCHLVGCHLVGWKSFLLGWVCLLILLLLGTPAHILGGSNVASTIPLLCQYNTAEWTLVHSQEEECPLTMVRAPCGINFIVWERSAKFSFDIEANGWHSMCTCKCLGMSTSLATHFLAAEQLLPDFTASLWCTCNPGMSERQICSSHKQFAYLFCLHLSDCCCFSILLFSRLLCYSTFLLRLMYQFNSSNFSCWIS